MTEANGTVRNVTNLLLICLFSINVIGCIRAIAYGLSNFEPRRNVEDLSWSVIFDVKDAPRIGRPVVENVCKITEVIEVDRHVSSHSITQERKIDYKAALNHLRKVAFKKKLDVWVPHHLTPKNIMDRISNCEALAKRNETDPFFKRLVTWDEKGVAYDNIV
ncbi:histone-lysine N-methyltransferase SETMAR [Trichonephila clavipes]|uniref:Histone-lysine N-methyltransferase SETMAR n=1 Tax=Trichonephila clavipes TaxID=2585209 RepID=A0A8X6REM9_TRICX|nr:histone-lysine N-methyltransferase SETMAR [Trichonephila clavipes]